MFFYVYKFFIFLFKNFSYFLISLEIKSNETIERRILVIEAVRELNDGIILMIAIPMKT